MRIVVPFLNAYARTGGHRRLLELASTLAERGHEVFLLKSRSLPMDLGQVRTVDLPAPSRRSLLPLSVRYAAVVRRRSTEIRQGIGTADVVMVHGETNLPAGVALARMLRARLVYALRSNGVVEMETYLRLREGGARGMLRARWEWLKACWYERYAARHACTVVVQSEFDRASFLSRVPTAVRKMVVIGGNIAPPRFRPDTRDTNTSTRLRRVVYVGGMGKRKGIRYLVEAICQAREAGCDIELTMVGSGQALDGIVRQAVARGHAQAIHLVGRQRDPFPFIAEADLMVVPSLFDSYPDTILEALHVGTPVIGTKVGGIPEMLVHEELLVDPGSAEAIRRRLEELHRDPELYGRVRALCRARRSAFEFDWTEAFERAMLDRRPGVGEYCRRHE